MRAPAVLPAPATLRIGHTRRLRSLVALLLATAALDAHGASFPVNPTADALVTTGPSGTLSNANFGGAGAVAVSAPGLARGEFQSVLQFDLAGARASFDASFGSGQWSLQSMTLQLTATPAISFFNPPAAGLFGISWMQNDSWTEGTGTPAAPGASGITFASLQGTFIAAGDQDLGTFAFGGATSGALTYSLGLTPGPAGDALAGDKLSLRLFGADSGVSGVFNSGNFGTVGNRPLLTLVAVPEPGTMSLGALGLISLAGWRRARARR